MGWHDTDQADQLRKSLVVFSNICCFEIVCQTRWLLPHETRGREAGAASLPAPGRNTVRLRSGLYWRSGHSAEGKQSKEVADGEDIYIDVVFPRWRALKARKWVGRVAVTCVKCNITACQMFVAASRGENSVLLCVSGSQKNAKCVNVPQCDPGELAVGVPTQERLWVHMEHHHIESFPDAVQWIT